MKTLIIFISLCVIGIVIAGMSPELASPRSLPIVRAKPKSILPPHYETWLKICKQEQPSGKHGKWASIAWRNTKNYSFLGGCGYTLLNWSTFKRSGQPATMDKATPLEQLWACERGWRWAERTYPGAGYTLWDVRIGWTGFNKNGSWK